MIRSIHFLLPGFSKRKIYRTIFDKICTAYIECLTGIIFKTLIRNIKMREIKNSFIRQFALFVGYI